MKPLKNVLLICILLFASKAMIAQIKYSGCNNSGTWASAIGLSTQATNNYCFSSGNLSIASGYASTAIGTSSLASGQYSISLGKNAESYDYSYAFGWNAKANSTESVAIGTFNRTTASGAITIGTSNADAVLTNSINSSLMIGFNSTSPTLFISDSEPTQYHNGTGKVGIGTIYPYAKFHVNGNSYFNEDMVIGSELSNASLYISSLRSKGRQVVIADSQGKLSIIDDLEVPGDNLGNHIATQDIILSRYGLKYSSEKNNAISLNEDNEVFLNENVFIGSELEVNGSVSIGYTAHTIPGTNGLIVSGPVGIGTFAPEEELDVVGKIKTNELQLTGGYMNGYLLTSDPVGNAIWADPNSLNVGPWEKNGDFLYVNVNTKIGIGLPDPAEALDINGNMRIRGNIIAARTNYLPLKIFGGNNEIDGSFISLCNNVGQTGSIKMYAVGPESRLEFNVNEFKALDIRSDKQIVFGNPNEDGEVTILVNGEVNANLMRVQVDGWWDCVFDNDYELPSLYEVDKYIKENNKLPDIPAETELIQNGLNVAEMNALLVKKVEELTLYVIELQKQIDNLSK